MRFLVAVIALLIPFFSSARQLTDYVHPWVGSSNFGTTNPGAVCPNGMMSVSPFNVTGSEKNKWDKDSRWWSTPYTSDNCWFTGFSHVNLSGVGCPELGTIITMPTSGELSTDYLLYGSEYTGETAQPGYYALKLSKYDILAEVASTMRSSIERYTYRKGKAHVIVNLGQGLTNESGGFIRKVSDTEIEGMRLCGGFCYHSQAVFPQYFVIRVNKSPKEAGFWKKQPNMTAEAAWDEHAGKYKVYTDYAREMAGDDLGYRFTYDAEDGEQICVQMGVSFVSCENARQNLEAEQPACNFDQVRAESHRQWEEALERVKVSGGTEEQKEIFYTALYHALLHPNVLNDVNGEYPLMQGGKYAAQNGIEVVNPGIGKVAKGHNRYTVFSLWDTSRNLHQLLTLAYPEKQIDMVRSMVDMYKEWGWMPKWELYGRETFTMEGDPAIPVIADTYLKGLTDFDIQAAYKACLKSANTPGKDNKIRPDVDPYIAKGYIPLGYFAQDFSGDNSVSHALEYYVADNALALLSDKLAQEAKNGAQKAEYQKYAKEFRKRSKGWRHYYSKESGTLRPLNSNGTFLSPFNPKDGADFSNTPGFHEGSAWNYTFYVPHDIEGLAKAMGGDKAFVAKLQKVFDEGLYDPANEPDIAYPFLFSRFKGEEHRTAQTVAALLKKYYTTRPDGIPGNDDTGVMSAWAVFSMIGMYPDCPGEPQYTLFSPVFDSVEINGKYVIRKDQKIKKHRITHQEFVRDYAK
ncbi:MAG: glycoside hydrolase family 92 protein [Alloprevotella sp.]|nr:MAG: glycoside hydrolase family 92 protein [Alloprevotella sp.]RKV80112.1 MAG: glycoside hydrolase family 92 protein [Alloprevotella sp.]